MIKSMFYKEWLKTKWLLIIVLISTFVISIIWYHLIEKQIAADLKLYFFHQVTIQNTNYQTPILYLPLLLGIMLPFFQFVPEIISQRFKLWFRLPMSTHTLITLPFLYGLLVLLAFFMIITIVFIIVSLTFLKTYQLPFMSGLLITSYLSAIIVYHWIATIIFEPRWGNRIFYTFILSLMLIFFLEPHLNGTTAILNYYLAAFLIPSIFLPFSSIQRITRGLK